MSGLFEGQLEEFEGKILVTVNGIYDESDKRYSMRVQ